MKPILRQWMGYVKESVHRNIANGQITKKRVIFTGAGLILILLGLVVGGVYYTSGYFSRADSCFTKEQITSDSRCLYVYTNMVFEKGTKSAPHKGIACGTDVTSIIPESHLLDKIGHLDPNYKGTLCSTSTQPTSAPTAQPTAQATSQPTPTHTTQQPSPTQTSQSTYPTNTIAPTLTNEYVQATPTESAIATDYISPTQSPLRTITTLPVSGESHTLFDIAAGSLLGLGLLGIIL